MKFIKPFKIFESIKDTIDIEDVEDRLIDFQHLGFSVVISQSSSLILDFDKKRLERNLTNNVVNLANSYHIKSTEIESYNSGISHNTLTIGLKSRISSTNYLTDYVQINIDELTSVYDDFCHYLKQVYGLIPNYINVLSLNLRTKSGGGYEGRFLYFKDINSLKSFLNIKDSIDTANINITGFNLGFYRK